jgi:hypothetical protein
LAITVTTNQVYTAGFCVSGTTTDLSGCETLLAAPGAGLSIYLEQVTISNLTTANQITIGAAETAGAVTTVLLGPIVIAANTAMRIPLVRPIKLAADTALVADATGTTAVTIVAEGYVGS